MELWHALSRSGRRQTKYIVRTTKQHDHTHVKKHTKVNNPNYRDGLWVQ